MEPQREKHAWKNLKRMPGKPLPLNNRTFKGGPTQPGAA